MTMTGYHLLGLVVKSNLHKVIVVTTAATVTAHVATQTADQILELEATAMVTAMIITAATNELVYINMVFGLKVAFLLSNYFCFLLLKYFQEKTRDFFLENI